MGRRTSVALGTTLLTVGIVGAVLLGSSSAGTQASPDHLRAGPSSSASMMVSPSEVIRGTPDDESGRAEQMMAQCAEMMGSKDSANGMMSGSMSGSMSGGMMSGGMMSGGMMSGGMMSRGMMSGGFLMMLLWTLLAIVILIGAILLVRALWTRSPDRYTVPPANQRGGGAVDLLEERFARGEIDQDEFEQRRRTLLSPKSEQGLAPIGGGLGLTGPGPPHIR